MAARALAAAMAAIMFMIVAVVVVDAAGSPPPPVSVETISEVGERMVGMNYGGIAAGAPVIGDAFLS